MLVLQYLKFQLIVTSMHTSLRTHACTHTTAIVSAQGKQYRYNGEITVNHHRNE